MTLPPLHQSAALYLSWIGGLCGAIVLMLADLLPFALPFATPDAFFSALVALEVFFALLVWPLFVPSILRSGGRPPMLPAYLAVLLLFGLPLVLIGANVSSVGIGSVVRSQALVAGVALLAAGLAARTPAAMPWYFLAVFWVSAAHPFWYLLQDQLGARGPAVAVYVSPFWSAVSANAASAWVQAGVFGVAGLTLLLLPDRKKEAAP